MDSRFRPERRSLLTSQTLPEEQPRRLQGEFMPAGRHGESRPFASGPEIKRIDQIDAAFRFLGREAVGLSVGDVQRTGGDQQRQFG